MSWRGQGRTECGRFGDGVVSLLDEDVVVDVSDIIDGDVVDACVGRDLVEDDDDDDGDDDGDDAGAADGGDCGFVDCAGGDTCVGVGVGVGG